MKTPVLGSSARPPFEGVTDGRRRNMRANRSKDTKPELVIRRMLHSMGYRFRIHAKNLPGRPDIAFTARRCAIQVHGCFWHGHGCHPLGLLPKTRRDYWEPKISGNRERDARNEAAITALGWEVMILWECRVRTDTEGIRRELVTFLGPVRAEVHNGKVGSSSRMRCAVSRGDRAR